MRDCLFASVLQIVMGRERCSLHVLRTVFSVNRTMHEVWRAEVTKLPNEVGPLLQTQVPPWANSMDLHRLLYDATFTFGRSYCRTCGKEGKRRSKLCRRCTDFYARDSTPMRHAKRYLERISGKKPRTAKAAEDLRRRIQSLPTFHNRIQWADVKRQAREIQPSATRTTATSCRFF